MVFVVYLDKIMNCSECEIQQILTKLVCLKQHDQKIYNHFILKLVGLVVVLSGWSRYSRGGGGQSVTDHFLPYLIFPV